MKTEEKILQLSSNLENYINSQKQEAELNKIKLIENKLSKKMNQMEKRIWGELEKMQSDYQSGERGIAGLHFLSRPRFLLLASLVISDVIMLLIWLP